ncbi:MAG: nucleotidyltransferase domain-containing protein, partial [Chloroflexi bacterium]|nr:nucleotidyltransferase domain-containing protein [Chloroflexota bacterium]
MMEQNEQLQAIVETIVRVAQPEQVILFGSRAKGEA